MCLWHGPHIYTYRLQHLSHVQYIHVYARLELFLCLLCALVSTVAYPRYSASESCVEHTATSITHACNTKLYIFRAWCVKINVAHNRRVCKYWTILNITRRHHSTQHIRPARKNISILDTPWKMKRERKNWNEKIEARPELKRSVVVFLHFIFFFASSSSSDFRYENKVDSRLDWRPPGKFALWMCVTNHTVAAVRMQKWTKIKWLVDSVFSVRTEYASRQWTIYISTK